MWTTPSESMATSVAAGSPGAGIVASTDVGGGGKPRSGNRCIHRQSEYRVIGVRCGGGRSGSRGRDGGREARGRGHSGRTGRRSRCSGGESRGRCCGGGGHWGWG